MSSIRISLLGGAAGSLLVLASGLTPLSAQAAAPADQAAPAADTPKPDREIAEIIVTAQKRSENINKVGMSITAKSGDELLREGVTSTADLSKVVPGFTFEGANGNPPVYSIRGIGFHETSLASGQAVAIYQDEVPIPFAQETLGADLDISRVEVLKGPQGTLFGENATGGAVNYVTAKPTSMPQAGIDASYGSYNATDVSAFVSGPLTDTIKARAAIRTIQSSGWQKDYAPVQPGQPADLGTLGAQNKTEARILVDWQATSRLKVAFNFNLFHDGSDTQAAQMIRLDPSSAANPLIPAVANFPSAPHNDRAAAWDPGVSYAQNNTFYQGVVRADLEVGNSTTLTSITAYEHYKRDEPAQDVDGTPYEDLQFGYFGHVQTAYEELRAAGLISDRGHWIVGANYEHDTTYDQDNYTYPDATTRVLFGVADPDSNTKSTNRINTYAVYGNADYKVTPTVQLQAGLRYTESDRTASGCSFDSGDGLFAQIFNNIQGALKGPANVTVIPPGGCVTLNQNFNPGLVTGTLNENNLSWRGGVNWTPSSNLLVYANVSKGYKAGSFPLEAAASSSQYAPVKQESLIAYEGGLKGQFFDRTLQLNGSAFYYDYTNKQIGGTYIDPIYGALNKLVTVPQSHVVGFELSADWRPIQGLTISPALTYVDSEIDGHFANLTPAGVSESFVGEPFPYSPKWQGFINAQYRRSVSDRLDGFISTNVSYQDKTNAEFGDLPVYKINSYTLVDLQAGVESKSGAYRLTIWGRNIFNTYYWTSAQRGFDFDTRYAGMPSTFGVTFSYRYR